MIRDISLGDFSAECDGNLSQYFVDDITAYQAAIDFEDHRYILLGRTGSGKSAILSHIKSNFSGDRNFIVTTIRPSIDYLDAIVRTERFAKLREVQGLESIVYKLIWNYIIMIEVLREKYGSDGPMKKGKLVIGQDLSAYNFLNKAKALSKENLTLFDLTMSIIDELELSLPGIKIATKKTDNIPFEITRNLLHEAENFHKNGFWDVVGGAKLYLLFDDLDVGWDPSNESQQLLLAGLFSIIKEYIYKPRVKPLIALRTNILQGLKAAAT